MAYLWGWYSECFTGAPLTWSDLHNWAAITETPIKGWEAKLIKAIDAEYWISRGSAS